MASIPQSSPFVCFNVISAPPPAAHAPVLQPTTPAASDSKCPGVVASSTLYWPLGSTLKVRFLSGDDQLIKRIMSVAKQWSVYANINFKRVESGDAEIRIKIDNSGVSYSTCGRPACDGDQGSPTMVFGWLTNHTADEEVSRTVLHEFGHVLGLTHEHQSPSAGVRWNVEKVYKHYISRLAHPDSSQGKSWAGVEDPAYKEYVRRHILDMVPSSNHSTFDPDSIMMYAVPPELTLDGVGFKQNETLSDQDKMFIAKCYPLKTAQLVVRDTLHELKQQRLPEAVTWLQLCAYFNPSAISSAYLKEWIKIAHPGKETLDNKIADALSTSNVWQYDASTRAYVLEASYYRKMQEYKSNALLQQAVKLLCAVGETWNFEMTDDWESTAQKAAEWKEHATLLIDEPLFEQLALQEKGMVYQKLGGLEHAMGNFEGAIKVHEMALALYQGALGQYDLDQAHTLDEIGICYLHQDLYGEALKRHQAAYDIKVQKLSDSHLDIAQSLNNIGCCYVGQGMHLQAEEELGRALALYKSAQKQHKKFSTVLARDEAQTLNNIGLCHYQQGQRVEALKEFEEALVILKKLGELHPNVAESNFIIGDYYREQGDYIRARKYFQEAVNTAEKSLGAGHPKTKLYRTKLYASSSCLLL